MSKIFGYSFETVVSWSLLKDLWLYAQTTLHFLCVVVNPHPENLLVQSSFIIPPWIVHHNSTGNTTHVGPLE